MKSVSFKMRHLLIGASIFAAHSPVWAQGANPQAAEGQGDAQAGPDASDIIVTANRRAERLQDIPIAISAATSEALDKANIQTVTDVQRIVPGLTIAKASFANTVFLRGVGFSGSVPGTESSVPIFIDGVYYQRTFPALLALNNVERIEVLKGPQGTLFGRNSTGGLIHVITKAPSEDPRLELTAGYGSFDTVDATLYGTTRVTEGITADLSVVYHNQRDGFGKDVLVGTDIYRDRYFTARGRVAFQPTDATKLLLSAYHTDGDGSGSLAGNPEPGRSIGAPPPSGAAPTRYTTLPGFYDTRSNLPQSEHLKSQGVSARFDQELPFADLVGIFDYHDAGFQYWLDTDFSPINWNLGAQRSKSRQHTAELQLISRSASIFKWTVGLFHMNSDDLVDGSVQYGPSQGGDGLNGVAFYSGQHVKSYAAYGQATLQFLPTTGLTVGGRYTKDDVSADGHTDRVRVSDFSYRPTFTTSVVGTRLQRSASWKKFTYRIALDHKVTDDILAYASFNTGYRAGLYALFPFTGAAPLNPETMKAYEVGLKSTLFDRRLRLNISAFRYDLADMQVTSTVNVGQGTVQIAQNAAAARNQGIDVDGNLIVTDELSIAFGAAYLKSRYTSFPGAQFTAENNQLVNGVVPGCTIPATGNLNPANGGNVNYCPGDAKGNALPRAPKFVGNIAFNYEKELGDGSKLNLATDFSYSSHYFWDPAHTFREDAYALLGVSATFTFPGERTWIKVWGTNITGAKYNSYAINNGSWAGVSRVPAAPTQYGVKVGTRF